MNAKLPQPAGGAAPQPSASRESTSTGHGKRDKEENDPFGKDGGGFVYICSLNEYDIKGNQSPCLNCLSRVRGQTSGWRWLLVESHLVTVVRFCPAPLPVSVFLSLVFPLRSLVLGVAPATVAWSPLRTHPAAEYVERSVLDKDRVVLEGVSCLPSFGATTGTFSR